MKEVSIGRFARSRRFARCVAVACALIVVLVGGSGAAGVAGPGGPPGLQVAPINPDFEASFRSASSVSYGYVPPSFDLSHIETLSPSRAQSQQLPDRFDWRDHNGENLVTPVRNQNPCGTCWIFGTLASLESNVLIDEGVAYDFSEQSVGLCVDPSLTHVYDDPQDPCSPGGGNALIASDVLVKKGAVAEACAPYDTSALRCDGSCVCDTCAPVKTVSGYRLVTDDGAQIDLIKNALIEQGPLIVSFQHEGSCQYSDPTWGTIYDCYRTPGSANHCVLIVGWDDDVPHPHPSHSGTGAWIVKNSWGTGHGNQGFGYLAFDSSDTQGVGYLDYRDALSSEDLLHWDEAGLVYGVGYASNTAWMANVFTSDRAQRLTHVEFWTTSDSAQYEVYVWAGQFGSQLAHQAGTAPEFGYYSVPLSTPIAVPEGQAFTIGVRMTTPGYNHPLAVEGAYPAGGVNPPIQAGVSFSRASAGGPWQDLSGDDLNACLRARLSPHARVLYIPLVVGGEGAMYDFEGGGAGWSEYSRQGRTVITNDLPDGITARSGDWAAWLGGAYDELSYVQRSVAVSHAFPYLAYWHWIDSVDYCYYDFGGVTVNGVARVEEYDLCASENTGGWVRRVVDLSSYTGQSITLRIWAEADWSLRSSLFIDDVSFVDSTSAAAAR